jgi:uncharacterized membrane protein
MAYDHVYSAGHIRFHVEQFYEFATYSTVFALFCIFMVVRYSAQSIKGTYRFHLLNITVFTLLCDLSISLLTQTYASLGPVNGICYPGILPKILGNWFQLDTAFRLTVVS